MTSATLGDYWPSKVRALEDEIARLQASKDEWIKQAAEMEAQRDRLRSALSDLLGAVIAGVADRRHIDRARKALAKEGK